MHAIAAKTPQHGAEQLSMPIARLGGRTPEAASPHGFCRRGVATWPTGASRVAPEGFCFSKADTVPLSHRIGMIYWSGRTCCGFPGWFWMRHIEGGNPSAPDLDHLASVGLSHGHRPGGCPGRLGVPPMWPRLGSLAALQGQNFSAPYGFRRANRNTILSPSRRRVGCDRLGLYVPRRSALGVV